MPASGTKIRPDAFRIHDERTHVILGRGVGFEIGHVVANPALLVLRSTRPAGDRDPTACR